MSSEIVKDYDGVVALLKQKHRNVDPFLMLKSSMLTRKYPGEDKQRFWLDMYVKHGANEESLSREIQSMVDKIPSNHGHGHYEIVLQTDLDTVLTLARHPEIEWVGGEVYPNA